MSQADHAMFFFDDGDEVAPEACQSAAAPMCLPSRQVMAGAIGELVEIAEALDNSDHWPVEALSTDHLDFIQSLDLISQKLREIARLMSVYQDKSSEAFDMELHSGLESLLRKMQAAR